jgi:hypothetical protein
MKAVLLVITSKACPACTNFKKRQLLEIEKEYKNNDKVRVEKLDYPDFNVETEYRPYVRFFPTLMLVPESVWKTNKFTAIVKHGDENPPKIDYSIASIKKWVEETLKQKIFQGNGEKITGNLIKSLEDGRYVVPTYGTYKRFKPTPPDEEE